MKTFPPRFTALLALLLAVGLLPGCSMRGAAPSPEIGVAPGRYAEAFEAAREALIEARFELERVDAAAGVITTRPKQSAGAFTFWDTEQSTPAQQLEDTLHPQRRLVRVSFLPPEPPDDERIESQAMAPTHMPDLRGHEDGLRLSVEVVIERRNRPNRRIETESIRRSSSFVDTGLYPRRMTPEYWVAVRRDTNLARRIAGRIQERLGDAPQAPAEPAS
ncbi:MAG: hypothetical protein JJU33_08170 [Phycisphaerales bacterium]|nr:hypothetical protein [Phycisphaerales bacterium]